MNVGTVMQRQWFSRNDDEKFGSLDEMYLALTARKERTNSINTQLSKIEILPAPEDGIEVVDTLSGTHMAPTHWAFGQLCSKFGAHPSFMRELNGALVADCMNYLVHKQAKEKDLKLGFMTIDPADSGQMSSLAATTSQQYGRIWDAEVVQAIMEIVDATGGRFSSPIDWTGKKRALFASDRDMYVLVTDGGSIVDGGGERDQLHRGWMVGNSEVGARSWFMATFLFRWVCGNFAIHGLEDVQIKSIQHIFGAPTKFVKQAIPALKAYVEASPRPLELAIRKAKELTLPKEIEAYAAYFKHRGFTTHETMMARLIADKEEGGHETLWQMINGFTASARKIEHRDSRLALETKAGALLKMMA